MAVVLRSEWAEGKARLRTVDAAKFGAAAGDGKSDTQAVLAAIEECRKSKPALLRFARGQYDFFAEDNPEGKNHIFAFSHLKDTTIDGGGSTFMFHGFRGAFVFNSCENVTVRKLTIDYARPPFSLGKVLSVNGKSFDIEVNKEYPITGNEGVGAFMAYDPEAGRPLAGGIEEYYSSTSTELVRPHVMRVNLNHDATIKPGTWVILRHAVYGPNAFAASGCTSFTLDNVNIYTAPGMAFVALRCKNIVVRELRVVPRPGSGYPMSVTADGLHFSGNTGLISVEDCEFEGMGDDAANIKTGLYARVTEKIDDRTVLAVHNLKMVDLPSPGDRIEIAHHGDMVSLATAVAESAEGLKDGAQKIRFKDPLPEDLQVGDLLGNATRVAKVRIKNCSVRNNRARGFLIQNRDVAVENCKFENCTSGGIWVLTEVFYFYESISSQDVVVRNCKFENCGYWPGNCVLGAFVQLGPDSYTTSPGVHRNVLFEGNVIRGSDNSAILINGVDGAVLRNNIIEQVCRKPYYEHGDAAICVTGSANVVLERNKCEPSKQGRGCKRVLEIGPGCDKDAVKLVNNTGF